jgi:predicted Holliday junction resolvase-like endonuclease
LTLALVAALAAFVWLLVRHAIYRSTHKWSDSDLEAARRDSVARSRSVVSGKVQENLTPLFPEFLSRFNPRDARFVGTPLDFIVFDGLDDGEIQSIVFVEVKTGKATLSKRERCVRDAVEAGRVAYQLLRLPNAQQALDGTAAPLPVDAPDAPPALQA